MPTPNLDGYDEPAFRIAAERLDAAILVEPDTFRLSSKDADRLFRALAVEFNAMGFHRVNYDNVVTFDLVVQVPEPAGADVDDDAAGQGRSDRVCYHLEEPRTGLR